jgi:hypothetical protein
VPSRGFSRAINTDRQIAALNYASKLAARRLSVNASKLAARHLSVNASKLAARHLSVNASKLAARHLSVNRQAPRSRQVPSRGFSRAINRRASAWKCRAIRTYPLLLSRDFVFGSVPFPARYLFTGVAGWLRAQILAETLQGSWADSRNRVSFAPLQHAVRVGVMFLSCHGGTAALHALQQSWDVGRGVGSYQNMQMR